MYYKEQWSKEMARVFAKKKPNLDELIHPQTEDQKERARLLRETYKMDPEFMKQVDEEYGPLEWRLPEAHAIYWAALGLKKAAENPTKIKQDDLITLRRVIYQSMLLSFQRGRLVTNPFANAFEFGPNLEIIPKVNFAYEQAAKEDEKNRDHIEKAHRNFLRDAVYFLYEYNRLADAAQWYKYLSTKYPDKPLLDNKPNSLPATLTLDQYAVARVQGDVSDSGGRDRTKGVIEGLLVNSYRSMVLNEDAPAAGFKLLARQVWMSYQSGLSHRNGSPRLACRPLRKLIRTCGGACSIPRRASRRKCARCCAPNWVSRPETAAPPATTNAPPEKASSQ